MMFAMTVCKKWTLHNVFEYCRSLRPIISRAKREQKFALQLELFEKSVRLQRGGATDESSTAPWPSMLVNSKRQMRSSKKK